MCEWGTTTRLNLVIPANLSRYGHAYVKPVDVDSCIASIVKALNDAGLVTVASCCGHGKVPGNIALADGRELIIVPDYETARAAERQLGTIMSSKTASHKRHFTKLAPEQASRGP